MRRRQPHSRIVLFAAISLSLIACSSGATATPIIIYVTPGPSAVSPPPASLAGETPPASQAGQTLEPVPSEEPTSAPTPAPTPDTEADVAVVRTFFKTFGDSIGSVKYQAIVEVENSGGGWANINSGSQDFTIYAKDGSVLTTGNFTYAFPQSLGPGELGYYIETGYFDDGTNPKTVGEFEPSLEYSTDDSPNPAFKVSKVRVKAESYGTGLAVTGVVTNTSPEKSESLTVGVVFFDSQGNIIGGLLDNTGGSLASGKSKGFDTSYPGTPPLKPSQVKTFRAFAFDYTFF